MAEDDGTAEAAGLGVADDGAVGLGAADGGGVVAEGVGVAFGSYGPAKVKSGVCW